MSIGTIVLAVLTGEILHASNGIALGIKVDIKECSSQQRHPSKVEDNGY